MTLTYHEISLGNTNHGDDQYLRRGLSHCYQMADWPVIKGPVSQSSLHLQLDSVLTLTNTCWLSTNPAWTTDVTSVAVLFLRSVLESWPWMVSVVTTIGRWDCVLLCCYFTCLSWDWTLNPLQLRTAFASWSPGLHFPGWDNGCAHSMSSLFCCLLGLFSNFPT